MILSHWFCESYVLGQVVPKSRGPVKQQNKANKSTESWTHRVESWLSGTRFGECLILTITFSRLGGICLNFNILLEKFSLVFLFCFFLLNLHWLCWCQSSLKMLHVFIFKGHLLFFFLTGKSPAGVHILWEQQWHRDWTRGNRKHFGLATKDPDLQS